jgi:hypothetical protein
VERPETDGKWRVVGAASQGTAHRKQDLPCQDAQAFRLLPNGALLAALADGAGSAEFSEQGAQCAVEEALEALASGLETGLPADEDEWIGLIVNAFERAQAALHRLAVEMDVPLRDLATTLACAAAFNNWLAAGQLGDGAVIAQGSAGELFPVTQAQRGEYANETFFLTQEGALEQVEIRILDRPVQALALMSDGLTRLALKMPYFEPHPPFFGPLFAFAAAVEEQDRAKERLGEFLASDRVCARTDDDKSIILAVSTITPPLESIEEEETEPQNAFTEVAPIGDDREGSLDQ